MHLHDVAGRLRLVLKTRRDCECTPGRGSHGGTLVSSSKARTLDLGNHALESNQAKIRCGWDLWNRFA